MLDPLIEKAMMTTQSELKALNVDVNLEVIREVVRCAFDDARSKLSSLEYDSVLLHRFGTWSMRDKYAYEKDNDGNYIKPKPEFEDRLNDLKRRRKSMARKCGNCGRKGEVIKTNPFIKNKM